ncbi:hypothetical protein KP509_04G060000 [Ceratopteris richardii]|uniref:Uncharacterized protein n=1 Tax=Ceratopteris richardii TaxID=49495 RepID=A0A8T2V585_CERRI|nr:hypothetical protein KP509_04G060000 [Ceratopteris richardii]
MVATNTHLSPLQHHPRGSSALTSSIRNYSRIQSEVQREGSEVHKENLLALSLSRKSRHSSIAVEYPEAVTLSSVQIGPLHASTNIGLQSVVPKEFFALSQTQEHMTSQLDVNPPGEKNILSPSDASELRSSRPLTPTSSAILSTALGEEAKNPAEPFTGMVSRSYTSISSGLATPLNQKLQFGVPQSRVKDRITKDEKCQSNGANLETSSQMEVCNAKRRKYTKAEEDGISVRSLGMITSEQSIHTVSVVDGSRSSFAPLCGTSVTTEMSEAHPATALKLFTSAAHAQMPKALSTFTEGVPSLLLSRDHPQQQNRMQKCDDFSADADWGKFLALSATPVANENVLADVSELPFQQRFKQLQAFLKHCDEADQNECIQALWSLTAAARSGYAVELETRAILLSLEEGKEMKRMGMLKILGKMSEQSLDDAGATPQGPRLPAPGAVVKLKTAPQ